MNGRLACGLIMVDLRGALYGGGGWGSFPPPDLPVTPLPYAGEGTERRWLALRTANRIIQQHAAPAFRLGSCPLDGRLSPVLEAAADLVLVQPLVQVQPFQDELRRRRHRRLALARPQLLDRGVQPLRLLHQLRVVRRGRLVAHLHREAGLELRHYALQLAQPELAVEHRQGRPLDQPVDDLLLAPLLNRLELQLAADRGHQVRQVADPRHDLLLVQTDRPPEGVGQKRLVVGYRGADGDAGALVDIRAAAGQPRHLGDDLLHVRGDVDRGLLLVLEVRSLLLHDGDLRLHVLRVVGADLGAVAVLQRRDDAAAVRVVLWVGGSDDEDVQRQADTVAADLDVALLHDVQQPHLDALRQVRQLVDAEDAAVVAGDQAVVDRE